MHVATSASGDVPLELIELPARPLRPREVRVRVRAIGVNPVDWKMRSGGPLRLAHRLLGPSGPLVVGVDFAGEIVEIGAQSGDLAVGARVVGGTNFARGQRGSYADEVIVQSDQCAILPAEVSFDDAACLPVPYVTAARALREIGRIGHIGHIDHIDHIGPIDPIDPERNAKVLILGASGGVGLAGIQLARALGAEVFGVCSTANVALVERMGATAIDYRKADALDTARAHAPFDFILHAVGTATYALPRCRALLAPRGRVGLVVVRPADYPSLLFRPSVHAVLGKPTRAHLEPLVAMLAAGELSCLIEERFPLADAEKAHVRSKSGKVVGKLLLIP